ncbi:uncharacterized protein LOC123292838 [Chrysoperla carnea]|uniref:uncharacterized protein LOC123292838 n=1 Tax=Chrysoperla carnea TaxID=189513 RepID=UPI001D05C9CB|nr:uncharacterized protein LOC123292838 [Chrysoperla carnea]
MNNTLYVLAILLVFTVFYTSTPVEGYALMRVDGGLMNFGLTSFIGLFINILKFALVAMVNVVRVIFFPKYIFSMVAKLILFGPIILIWRIVKSFVSTIFGGLTQLKIK